MTSSNTTRLHITPFSSELLASILPPSLQSSATDISFHSVLTFPENTYGYVTLPTMEAEKFKKKMDGSMLKGKKFRVETALPHKRQRDDTGDVGSDPIPVSSKSSKKRKTEENVIDGHELKDRSVKRGWTESAEIKMEKRKAEKRKGKEEKKTKAQPKSKYTDKPECLFRTKVPPNRLPTTPADDKHAKKKKKNPKESVVHEFTNTVTHPSFVRSGAEGAAPTATFEEGKGWVDDSGNLKEPASDRVRSDQYRPGQVPGAKGKRKSAKIPHPEQDLKPQKSKEKVVSSTKEATPESEDESEDWTSSSGESSSDDSTSESDDSTSTSSSDESDASDSDLKEQTSALTNKKKKRTPSIESDKEEAKEQSSGEETNEQPPAEVHPLEALFKRPAPDSTEPNPPKEANTQFSFFGNDDIESEEEDLGTTGPITPFTKKDIEERGLRSAAPTPDTVSAGRHIQWNESEDEEDDCYTSPVPRSSAAGGESDFAKWFWENRGDNNRAWKKRRRDAAKEERQRENRRKGMRGKS